MTDDRKMRLLELYEAHGDPDTFAEVKRLYEQALAGAEASDPETLTAYGYLLECHGRYALRQAMAQYERAIKLDPDADKPHYQHIWVQAALRETEPAIALYSERLARSPTDVREHRFLANAYLAARDYQKAARVVDAGLALAPDDPMLLDVRATRGPRPGTRTGRWPTGAARSRSTPRTLARSTAARCCSSVWDGSRRPRPRGSPSSAGATHTRPR